MMASQWRLGFFGLRALGVLVLCFLPWPRLGPAFVSGFSSIAEHMLPDVRFHDDKRLEFRPGNPGDGTRWQFRVVLQDVRTFGETASIQLDLKVLVLMPLSIFLALTAAVPFRRGKEGVLTLLLGLCFLAAFVVMGLAVPVLWFLGDRHVGVLALRGPIRAFLKASMAVTEETECVTPALLWWLSRWTAGVALSRRGGNGSSLTAMPLS